MPKRPKQQTLEATLGRPKVKMSVRPRRSSRREPAASAAQEVRFSSPPSRPARQQQQQQHSPPPSSFMPRSQTGGPRTIVLDDSSDSAAEDAGIVEDDQPLVTPRSSLKRPAPPDDDDDDDGDESDDVVPSTAKRRRLQRTHVSRALDDDDDDEDDGDEAEDSSDEEPVPTPRRKANRAPSSSAGNSTPAKRGSRHRAQNAKKRQLELLRRRKQGGVVEEEDGSSSGEEQRALYDTDSDNPALKEFEDDEEDEAELPEPEPSSPAGRRSARKKSKGLVKFSSDIIDVRSDDSENHNDEDDLDDFVVEEEDGLLGVPEDALAEMPLEFTQHSRKSLKEHFRDAIEWLVQIRINPGFSERRHALYVMAWRKLDDEVQGLAASKFMSSVWKQDFYYALRARPEFESIELPKGDVHRLVNECEACGRKNHPATWTVAFRGAPYRKNHEKDGFLEDLESDSDSESDSDADSNAGQKQEYGEEGVPIPPASRQWYVGAVCTSNAETAHNLIHWKHALLEFVNDKLEEEGLFKPQKLAEREKMKPKKRYKLVDDIMDAWVNNGTVRALYGDFKSILDEARNKSTTGKRGKLVMS